MDRMWLLFSFLFTLPIFAQTAFIVNGSDREGNDCDFLRDLDRAHRSLNAYPSHYVFGEGASKELKCSSILRDEWEENQNASYEFNLKKPTPLFTPEAQGDGFDHTTLKEKIMSVAKTDPASPMLLYFSDHGQKEGTEFNQLDPDENRTSQISLERTTLGEQEYWQFLEELQRRRDGANLVLVHDHCFSGGMLRGAIKRKNDTLSVVPGVCGVANARASEISFTTQGIMKHLDRERIHTKSEADKNKNGELSLFEMMETYEKGQFSETTALKTSDLFLERYIEEFKEADFKMEVNPTVLRVPDVSKCSGILEDETLNELQMNMMKTMSTDLAQTYLSFLGTDRDSFLRKAGFKQGLTSYEELLQKEKGFEDELKKIYEENLEMEKKFRLETSSLWSKASWDKMQELEASGSDPEGLAVLRERYTEWRLANQSSLMNAWKANGYEPKGESLKKRADKVIIERAHTKRLKKVLIGLNALELMVQRNDLEGLSNLTRLYECEQTALHRY